MDVILCAFDNPRKKSNSQKTAVILFLPKCISLSKIKRARVTPGGIYIGLYTTYISDWINLLSIQNIAAILYKRGNSIIFSFILEYQTVFNREGFLV